ncbi:MAG: GNAT family N-acetyltransferase [Dehalococcoidia bacterium]
MAIDVRPITEDEYAEYASKRTIAFGGDARPERLVWRPGMLELERCFAAFEDGVMAGTAAAFTYRMGTPGGDVRCAGVTGVTVQSTHRRRGILTAMMRTQFDQVRDMGEPVAALWASESIIYGRFGYGLASEQYETSIERAHSAVAATPAKGRCRLLTREEAEKALPPLWEAERARRPGMMTRSEGWWRMRIFDDAEWDRGGLSANRYALYEEDGRALGYARYRTKADYDDQHLPTGRLRVEELFGLTRQAQVGLWSYVFGVDLIRTIEGFTRPADDLVPWILADRRRLRRVPTDSLWLRLVDIPAAFAARRARAEGRVVVEARDAFLPWAGGRFAIEAEGGELRAKPTTESAQLTMDTTALASLYLGGFSASLLALAGHIEGDPRHLAVADAILGWPVAPWSPEIF